MAEVLRRMPKSSCPSQVRLPPCNVPTTIYIGSINSSAVRVGEVLKPALHQNAVSVIVVHNHPSGDPTPSPEDVAVTRQLVEAGRLLGVDVLNYLIIGQGRWVSLRERRLGFAA